MKNLLLIYAFVLTSAILVSCSEDNSNDCEYIAVLVSGDDNWSILDVNTGEFVYRNEFKEKPSPIVNDIFYVKKEKDPFREFFNINNISNSLNNKKYIDCTFFQSGYALGLNKIGAPFCIINTKGEEKYLGKDIVWMSEFSNGTSVCTNKNGKLGIVDTNGDWVVKAGYDVIYPFSNDGFAIVGKKVESKPDSYSIIDREGKKYYTFNSDKYTPICGMKNGVLPVRKDNKVIYIDKDGNRILEAGNYMSDARLFYGIINDVSIYVSEDKKMGIMTSSGEKLIRDKYDLLFPLKNGVIMSCLDNKSGLIDKNDNQILKADYQNLIMLKDNRYIVQEENGSYALIDKQGQEVCKETFSDISYDSNAFGFNTDIYTANNIMVQLINHIKAAPKDLFADKYDEDSFIKEFLTDGFESENDEESEDNGFSEDELSSVQESLNEIANETLDAPNQESNPTVKLSPRQLVESLLSDMRSRNLTENDIKGYDSKTLRILRNAIFAIHGYKFKSSDLTTFYNQFNWYSARSNDVSAELNSHENYNVNFIKSHE